MSTTYTVGMDIPIYCTKCKLNLTGTVISMLEDEVAKIKCNTCGSGPKKFRPPKVAKPKKKKRATSSRSKKAAEAAVIDLGPEEWQAKLDSLGDVYTSVDYAITGSYEQDQILKHAKFGIGFVISLKLNKAHVLFNDGMKLMIMNHNPTAT